MKRLLIAAALILPLAEPAYAQLAPFNEAGVTYGHVHLRVRDMEVHKKLWVDHFGGVVTQKGSLTAVKVPGMLIAFTQAEPSAGSQGSIMDHFGFKVRNLQEFLTGWRAAGYEVQSEFKGTEGFPNAYLMAPDGVRVELQEDTTLPVKASAYHLHYFLPDQTKLRDWYVQMFGATSGKRGDHDAANVPGMNLSFSAGREVRPGTRGRAIDHVGFEIRNLEAFVKQLEAKGVKFDVPFRDVPSIGLKIAYLTDPAGTYIELTEGYVNY